MGAIGLNYYFQNIVMMLRDLGAYFLEHLIDSQNQQRLNQEIFTDLLFFVATIRRCWQWPRCNSSIQFHASL